MGLDKQAVRKLTACLSYGTVSVSMTLFNKAVFSIYQFNYPSFGESTLSPSPLSMRSKILIRLGHLTTSQFCVQSRPYRL